MRPTGPVSPAELLDRKVAARRNNWGPAIAGCSLVVFDKDGVLQDFRLRWVAITRERAAKVAELAAGRIEATALERLLGVSEDDAIAANGLLACGSRLESLTVTAAVLYQAGLDWPKAREFATEGFRLADDAIDFAKTSLALPGVIEAVQGLVAAGWRCAIATADQTDDARRFLDHMGILDHFAAVVGVDRVLAGKPDPALFLLACSEAGVMPERAIMVGDLSVDMQMGRAGGAAATIGVLSGIGDAASLGPDADWVLRDVPEVAALLVKY